MGDVAWFLFGILLVLCANLVAKVFRRGVDEAAIYTCVEEAVEHALIRYHNFDQAQKVAREIISLRLNAHHDLLEHFDEMSEDERREAGDMLSNADDLEKILDEMVEEGYLDREDKEHLVQMPPIPRHTKD